MGNPAATKKIFYSSWGGAPAPGAPPASATARAVATGGVYRDIYPHISVP